MVIDPFENIDITETLETVHPLESVSTVQQWYEKFLCNNQADYIVAVECSLYDESVSDQKRKVDYMRAFTRMYADVFFPGHGEICEFWHTNSKFDTDDPEHGSIYNYMAIHSFNLKFWAPNQKSFRQFLTGIYALSDALRITSRLPKTAKAVHVYSKEEVRKFYTEGRADNECFWISLPHDFMFKNPTAEPYIFPDGIISMTSATTEKFWEAVHYKALEFDVYRLFPHLTPDERTQETGRAFIDYILRHKDYYKQIIIQKT